MCAVSIFIMGLLVFRTWNQKHIDKIKERYAEFLMIEMLSFAESGRPTPMLFRPRWHSGRKRNSLKNVILEHLRSVTGSEKEYLTKRYSDLGYLARDFAHTKSAFWWKRLEAISNLTLLESAEFAPVFKSLTNDKNSLVAAFAHIPLSSLNHPLNQVCLLSDLPPAVLERQNVIHEVIRNWTRIYGFGVLLDQIPKISNPDLISLLVRAVSNAQSPEITAAFARYLENPGKLPSDALEQMLMTLKQVGDPDRATVVTKFLSYPVDVVRMRAVEYFLCIGDEETLQNSEIMNDQAFIVQRALRDVPRKAA